VYDGWNPAIHLVPRFDVPLDWPRYWVIDFGYVHPFVWQAWARSPDGQLIRYREIYMTRRLVEDHASTIIHVTKDEPKPSAVITDHDAEDRATFERKTGYRTTAAHKSVSDGIQAVAERLRLVNSAPQLLFMRDSLVERDRELVDAALPTCTEEEVTSYVWNTAANRKKGEEPVKEYDDGMDCTRYLVAHFDLAPRRATARSF
jgi:phage terminase large subunit